MIYPSLDAFKSARRRELSHPSVKPPPSDPRVRVRWCPARGVWDWGVVRGDEALASGSERTAYEASQEAHAALADAELAGEFGVVWAVGVTTVGDAAERWAQVGYRVAPGRRDTLARTLQSLARAGFARPHLFADGARGGEFDWTGLDATCRWPAVLTWANWFLALGELVARYPFAARYAIFQDDLVCVRNLRPYLESVPLPGPGYANLYAAPGHHADGRGWQEAPTIHTDPEGRRLQGGKGALATVMDRDTALAILTSPHANRKSTDPRPEFRHKRADGGLVNAVNHSGGREWVHVPSLVQHTGLRSSMGNGVAPPSVCFPGEDFDALALLEAVR